MTTHPDQPRMEYGGDSRGSGNSGLDDMLAGQALETRTILMFGEFTPALAQRVSQQLLLLASRSPDDIKLLVNAQGGQASDGEALFDVLRGVEPRVLVIGAGAVAGAPALAFVAPPRAQRFCLPHARFSLFQRSNGGLSAGADLLAAAEAVAGQRERITHIFARQMGQPVEIVAPEMERQDWLDAEEALAHGLVERIVTGASAL
jgi:ATP-dependent Clp protease protease subunit